MLDRPSKQVKTTFFPTSFPNHPTIYAAENVYQTNKNTSQSEHKHLCGTPLVYKLIDFILLPQLSQQ